MGQPPVFAPGSVRVLVMARAPVPGRAKTRLEPLLGSAGCARLQAGLVRRAAAVAGRIAPGGVIVAVAGDVGLVARLVPPGTRVTGQCDGDLGVRMATACRQVRADRPGPLLVIGTDCPALGPEHLSAAAERLTAGYDTVFGPAHDGGYYLVGHDLADPAPVFDLRTGLWGGPDVLAATLTAAGSAGLTAGLIDTEHDLDTPADVATARADPRVPRNIVALLDPAGAR